MRELRFESDGAKLFAVAEGSGPTVVMVHGGLASHLAALPLISPLSGRYRVVAPDLRGSGESRHGDPLTFDQLADDIEPLLDELRADRAVVGGLSSGSGVALRFALRHPARIAGLILVTPMYAGADRGYTAEQAAALAGMDAVASRAVKEGVEVLRPLYANLPPPVRDKALAMIEGFDAASVVATSRFIASGAQPFEAGADLGAVEVPTLLVRGADAMHPAEVSDLYAASIANCTVSTAAGNPEIAAAIGTFCDSLDLG